MRQLKDKEKPLLVQLSWVNDDREGRFLLHNLDDKAPVSSAAKICFQVIGIFQGCSQGWICMLKLPPPLFKLPRLEKYA